MAPIGSPLYPLLLSHIIDTLYLSFLIYIVEHLRFMKIIYYTAINFGVFMLFTQSTLGNLNKYTDQSKTGKCLILRIEAKQQSRKYHEMRNYT